MTKLWLDGRFAVSGRSSKIDMSNAIALHDFITDYLAANPSINATSLADTLSIGFATGGNNLELSNDDVVKAVNGGGELNLRAGGNGIVSLTTDNTTYAEGWVYLAPTSATMGFGLAVDSSIEFGADYAYYQATFANQALYMHNGRVGFYDTTGLAPTMNFLIGNNSIAPLSINSQTGIGVAINSIATMNAGVDRSVVLGGTNVTMKTNNSAYANQLALNADSSAFEGLVDTVTLTADRTYAFPDTSGDVRVISYIDVASPTVHTAANGEIVTVTTGAGDLAVNLPAANLGIQQITIKKIDNGAGKVNVTAAGVDTIDGAAFTPLNAQWNSVTVISNGSGSWFKIVSI